MSEFFKYQHLERYGTQETDGILLGDVFAFFKIDGTNGSVWIGDDGFLHCGSRNRELSVGADNAGFMNAVVNDYRYIGLKTKFPHLHLFGEWLVPHSLKTYRDDAWRRFYVFDVYDHQEERFLTYDEYKPILDELEMDYIPPLAVFRNPSIDQILEHLDKCGQFLVEDGKGLGEGLVLKNYEYVNKYGRQTWAKIITNEFKEKHHKEMGAPLVLGTKMVEDEIVNEYVTEHFVLKEKAKIEVERGEWSSRMIPELLGKVWYNLITEESWNFTKKHKNPRIDFGTLNKLTISKTKKVIGL